MEAVMAVSDGTVSDIARDSEGYYTLQIIHNNGFMSIYKNLAAITFMKGQRVTAGQAIGIMQKKKTPEKYAHLSFELRYQGKAVAPQQFISF
jgi:murein DD-endopeptidase MepM/ murein hydrolase activator NlpD